MYYLVYGLLYLLSLIPLRVLYILSDLLFVLTYYVFGYRKQVVMKNLETAFPQKSPEERKKIAKQFYRNFIDNFIETLKIMSKGGTWFKKHFVLDANPFKALKESGRKCQMHLGHNFNWELANVTMPYYVDFPFLAVYMPIKSKPVDRLFKHLRSKTGCIMLPATDMRNAMLPWRDQQYALALVADQAPGDVSRAYWLNFFGRPTPFVRGPESGARAGNIPVIFAQIYKVKRGYYHAHLEIGAENPAELPEGELTRRYIKFLEAAINEHPDMWLWSHRRWKWDWKEEYQKLWIGE